MKLYYRPVGSLEPLQELCVSKEPLRITPISPEEQEREPEPDPWQPMKPISFEFTVEGITHRMPPKSRYPRKLKKAINQMWEITHNGDEVSFIFKAKRKTRWQRKAMSMVRITPDGIEYPFKNGKARFFVLMNKL